MQKIILVVEDSLDIQYLLKRFFESEGYTVLAALNGREALSVLNSTKDLPFLILLDLMMPVMDGYEFRSEQEKDPKISHIPVVVMSADGNVHVKKTKIGAKDYVKKPLQIATLLSIVQKYCTSS